MKFATTLKIVLVYLAFVYGTALVLTSCSAAHEGDTSPCYSQKHYVGYGPGGFGKYRPKN